MSTTAEKAVARSFPHLLETFLPEIKRALPKHMDADRMARIALTEFRKNPKLGECDPKSVFASIIIGSQLGLEPGIMGQAFLVPYKGVCQFVPGWQGLNDLVSRAGRATTWTGAVREGDNFDFALGDRPFVTHKPADDNHDKPLTHVYAIGRIRGSDWPIIEVWSVSKIKAHRDKHNKVGDRHYSFNNFEMYGRKVPLLQVIKYLPKSVELATAVALEHAAEQGDQGLTIKDAIDGTWTPVPVENGNGAEKPASEDLKPRAKSDEPKATESKPAETATSVVSEKVHDAPLMNNGKPPLADTPIALNVLTVLKAKMEAGALSEADVFKKFGVTGWNELKTSQLDAIRTWIGNPNG
jgi:recombination protein RecT